MVLFRRLTAISKRDCNFYTQTPQKKSVLLFCVAPCCCAERISLSAQQPFCFQCISAKEDREQVAWWNHKKGFGNRTVGQKNQITAVKAPFLSHTEYLKARLSVSSQLKMKWQLRFTISTIRRQDNAENRKKRCFVYTQTVSLKTHNKFSRSTQRTGSCGYSQRVNLRFTGGFYNPERRV